MHPNDERVGSNFIVQVLPDQGITIYSDGAQTRSFCYADDMIEGLIRLMATEHQVTAPINIGNPNDCMIFQLATVIIEMIGASRKSLAGRCQRMIRAAACRISRSLRNICRESPERNPRRAFLA
jgi:nucleoside-diphosphate-sugar epimerase